MSGLHEKFIDSPKAKNVENLQGKMLSYQKQKQYF